MSVELRPRTQRLLQAMYSRREHRLTHRKDARGFWIFEQPRVRSVSDFVRIASFPRCPTAARKLAQGEVDRLVGEARYFETRYGSARP